jgi:hypothetical protein
MVQCGRTYASIFVLCKNRYRYHKNTIINKGLLSLVGFSDCPLLELVLSLPGQCDLFIVMFFGTVFLLPLLPCYESAYRIIAMLSLRLTFYRMRPIIDCHASLRLSCSYDVVWKHYAPD